MRKETVIKNIKRIIRDYGSFFSGEMGDTSPKVNEMGDLVALAEYFTEEEVEINVYDTSSSNSDEIHNYRMKYIHLSKDVLEEILLMAEQYEAEEIKTQKRISN